MIRTIKDIEKDIREVYTYNSVLKHELLNVHREQLTPCPCCGLPPRIDFEYFRNVRGVAILSHNEKDIPEKVCDDVLPEHNLVKSCEFRMDNDITSDFDRSINESIHDVIKQLEEWIGVRSE